MTSRRTETGGRIDRFRTIRFTFDGAPYTYAQATDDIKRIWQQVHSDLSAASYPTTYYLSTERGRELDRMSVAAWIDRYVPAATPRGSASCSTSHTTSSTARRRRSRAR